MKSSFVIYTQYYDQIKMLSDEDAGTLFKAIFLYEIDGSEPTQENGMVQMAFSFIKAQLDRDAEKYEQVCEKRRIAGSMGGYQKQANASKRKQMLASASKSKQNLANDSKSKQNLANLADNDNEYVNDNDNEINNKDIKHIFGIHHHVKLTEAEYIKLGEEFGTSLREDAIAFLDDYMEDKPSYKSKSNYLAIRRWVIDAVKEKKPNRVKQTDFHVMEKTDYEMKELERKLLNKAKEC